MNREDLSLLEEMYMKAIEAAKGEGDYIDPKADLKADVLAKVIGLVKSNIDTDEDEEHSSDEVFIYKTRSRRDFMIALNAWNMACALYDIIGWNRAIYNGKDYGKGSVIYRNKILTADEWSRLTNSFDKERKIEYDWEKKVYKDDEGEVPADEVFSVYTRDQINDELDTLLRDVSSFIYQIME